MIGIPHYLTPPQSEVLRSNLLESGFNCLLQMNTGSGKTWLAEYAIARTVLRGFRAIYLSPTRALAHELFCRWKAQMPETEIGIFTGDFGHSNEAYPVSFGRAQVLIMTPERLDACTRHWRTHWGWLPDVDLLVVDEFHMLGDGARGARLEGCLGRFRRLNPFSRILGLSATLGNREELANWLDGVDYTADWRPIPLTWRIAHYRKADEKLEVTAAEVQRVLLEGGKSLIFVQSRRRAESLSSWFGNQGFKAKHHHAGLGLKEREGIETGFRNHLFDVLVATSTLEVGINLPVRQVVLYDLQSFNGSEYRPLLVNQVWQRVGRAGRPSLDTAGEAVLIAPRWESRETQSYQSGKFESIKSGLTEQRALAEQIIVEVSSGLCKTRSNLKSAFALTLAAHQTRLPLLDPIINDLCQAGMLSEITSDVETNKPRLRLKSTPLGRIAARQMLSPSTVLLFQKVTQNKTNLRFFDILLIAAASEDCEPILQVDYEELGDLSFALSKEPSQLLHLGQQELSEELGIRGLRLLAAIKVAMVIRAWTRKSDTEAVALAFNCYPFEIKKLCDSLDRLLSAMSSCLKLTPKEDNDPLSSIDSPLFEKVSALKNMIKAGLDETTVTLTLIPGMGPTIASRLAKHGIKDIEDLAQCAPDDITPIGGISEKRAARWIDDAEKLMYTMTFRYFEEIGSEPAPVDCVWPSHIDPYRVRRALELQVKQVTESCYQVTGGSDPHQVQSGNEELKCDCPDAAKGNTCKHLIAVNIVCGNPFFLELRDRLILDTQKNKFDLLSLWLESGRRH